MNGKPFSRTWEKALGIIGIVFNAAAILLFIIGIVNVGQYDGSPLQMQLEEDIMNDPTLTIEEAETTVELVNGFIESFSVIGWLMVAVLALATILAVIAVISLNGNRKPKLAGILFVIAGLLSGILSLTSLIFYIAAIMCFVRKPPLADEPVLVAEERDLRTDEDTPYRPL